MYLLYILFNKEIHSKINYIWTPCNQAYEETSWSFTWSFFVFYCYCHCLCLPKN